MTEKIAEIIGMMLFMASPLVIARVMFWAADKTLGKGPPS